MKKYFYANGLEKDGPLNIEELKKKDIQPKSLIWHEGLDDWTEAEKIDELREFFELAPPPLDTEITNEKESLNQTKPQIIKIKKEGMFSKPFSFEGRIRRTEYGISLILFMFISVFANAIIKSDDNLFAFIAYIAMFWFLWAQGAKRCHDLGNSGWWQLIPLYVLLMLFQDGQPLMNEYGKNPKD